MREVAALVRRHLEGIVAWAQSRQPNGILEAINSFFRAAKRRAGGVVRLSTMRTVFFLIAGKLGLRTIHPLEKQPTRSSTEPKKGMAARIPRRPSR